MNNEDKYLADKFGRENHFHVPDGYFDHFSSRLMERLAEQTTEGDGINHPEVQRPDAREQAAIRPLPVRPQRRKWLWAVAAVFAGLVVSTITWHEMNRTGSQTSIQQGAPDEVSVSHMASNDGSTSYFSDSDMQEMVDYTMLDNEDMYAYIADN